MKAITSISVEPEVLSSARKMNLNISATCETALRQAIHVKDGDANDINLELLYINRQALQNAQIKGGAELAEINRKIEEIEAIRVRQQAEQLQKEKEKIEAAKKCINCGRTLNPELKSHPYKLGIVCNACFMLSHKADHDRWNDVKPIP